MEQIDLTKELKKAKKGLRHFYLLRLKLLARFEKYAIVGIISSILNFTLLYLFVSFFNIFYIFATASAYLIGVSMNYTLNKVWIFKKTKVGFIHGYERFIPIAIFNIILTLILMWVFVSILEYHYMFSRVIIAGAVGTLGFFLNSRYVFKRL